MSYILLNVFCRRVPSLMDYGRKDEVLLSESGTKLCQWMRRPRSHLPQSTSELENHFEDSEVTVRRPVTIRNSNCGCRVVPYENLSDQSINSLRSKCP
jgi:hypothetical protein